MDFVPVMILTKEIATKMEIEPKIHEKRLIRRKNNFDESIGEGGILSLEQSFRINYFIYIIVQTISSIISRFEQFQMYENMLGFLFNFKKLQSLSDNVLKTYCVNIENALET